MRAKNVILCTAITMVITGLVFVMGFLDDRSKEALEVYQVYLDGKSLGAITNEEELYALINQEQKDIKDEYAVDNVYPPNGFNITKEVTYNEKVQDVKDIYDEIKDKESFTVKGYSVTIKYNDEKKQDVVLHVLDKEIVVEALNDLITTFIPAEKYNAYLNDTQVEIVDTGSLIESVYFEQNITIKEDYISTDDKIFTTKEELLQYLMFGTNKASEKYTVVVGDTIESVAYNHQLNTKEFLIANPNFKSEDSLLSIGQQVNIALINPLINVIEERHVVEDVDIDFQTEVAYDDTQYTTYSQVTQEGVKGINRITQKVKLTNGQTNEGAVIVSYTTIKEPVVQKVTKGTKKSYSGGWGGPITGSYVDTGAAWGWPTNSPYVLTSPFGYRWGSLHEGMDISGTGYGSPIFASLDGVVVNAGYGGMVGSAAGYNVVIQHYNGYYTVYAHMSGVNVSVGQSVSRGQQIGTMGKSGTATGTHLHFAVYDGIPYRGGRPFNPMQLWQ